MNDEVTLISQNEFARRIGTTHPTLQRWIDKGDIKPYVTTPSHRNKFTLQQVDEYFQKFKPEVQNG